MKSSGMKRGLAALAISGLAVAGVPALAMADEIDTQVTAANAADLVELYNINVGAGGAIDMTAKNDGTDTTVRLEAGGGVNVARVTFQVSRNFGAFADIATVDAPNDDGAFSYEWTPADSGAFAGDSIRIRAFNPDEVGGPTFDNSGPMTLRNATALNTQAINITEGSQKGYFFDPDIPGDFTLGVVGTTSVLSTAGADVPLISWMGGDGIGNDTSSDTSNSGDGTWEGVLRSDDVSYTFDDPALPPAEEDQMVIRAMTDTQSVTEDQTDDFEGFTLYEQELTSLTATLAPAEEPDPGLVTVTVLDQNGAPIAGIDVYEDNGAFVDETNGLGQVQTENFGELQYFYANADADNDFSPGAGDKRSNDVNNRAAVVDVDTSPSEEAQPVGTTVTETVTVTDTNGDPISNREVRIKRQGPGSEGETVFHTTDSNGMLTYEFVCSVAGVTTLEFGISGPVPILADPYSYAIANDTVICGDVTPPVVKDPIVVKLNGKNNGGKDVLNVNAPSKAKGATVRLQKKVNGQWKQVGPAKTLNSLGNKTFKVKDRNGNKGTKYRAKVSATDTTKGDTSNVVTQK